MSTGAKYLSHHSNTGAKYSALGARTTRRRARTKATVKLSSIPQSSTFKLSGMPGGQRGNAKAKAAMPKLPSCNAKAVEADKKNIQAAMPKLQRYLFLV